MVEGLMHLRGQEVAAYLNGVCRVQGVTALMTGNSCGLGVWMGALASGQPTFDDWTAKAT